jgi:hypothetical protein
MKKYFKVASESLFDQGHTYFEFNGEMVVRQVEHYGDKWYSSRDDYHKELGPSLCDVPLSQMELFDEDEITSEEFEIAWNEAGKY